MFKTFQCNMDSEFYREVIYDHLFPFIGKKFNYKAKLHQDNDTNHKSGICTDALKDLEINWVIVIIFFFKY
jgi:hypothetical protein